MHHAASLAPALAVAWSLTSDRLWAGLVLIGAALHANDSGAAEQHLGCMGLEWLVPASVIASLHG
jgi:hypothetical protein